MAEPESGEHGHEHHGLHLELGHSLGFLTHKLGPLPIWGWLLGAGAGIGVLLVLRSKQGGLGNGTALPATPTPAGTGSGGSGTDATAGLAAQEQSDVQSLLQSQQQADQQTNDALAQLQGEFQSSLDALSQSVDAKLNMIPATAADAAPSAGSVISTLVRLDPAFLARGATGQQPNGMPPGGNHSGTPAPNGGGANGGRTTAVTDSAAVAAFGSVQNWAAAHNAEIAAGAPGNPVDPNTGM